MSADLNLVGAEWIKSSYSDANGGDCVEFTRDFAWTKSSYSEGNGGECIEFSRTLTHPHGLIPVRDSKNPDGPALLFPATDWATFISAVKQGEFGA
ncbi:DUF397 domain-containing protein [Streptomyces sp. NRRL S-337]|uniref:DUF397 domain-containing protein n=1 Tax=Streptomyces sp. NRRL S-337 TaxID=1463900 RepID=UPI0004C650C2|nr:DUF397 domain-containing protein [Streptomyces sp. NRRL S-337]